jgi:hypothetical protein
MCRQKMPMSTVQTSIQNVIKKEVARKDFVGTLGMAALIILGIEPILKLLAKPTTHTQPTEGYDDVVYGGSKSKGLS